MTTMTTTTPPNSQHPLAMLLKTHIMKGLRSRIRGPAAAQQHGSLVDSDVQIPPKAGYSGHVGNAIDHDDCRGLGDVRFSGCLV